MSPRHSLLQSTRLAMEEEDLAVLTMVYELLCKERMKRKHRWWVHSILQKKKEQGAYHNLARDLHDASNAVSCVLCL